jgi:hypothetical protein
MRGVVVHVGENMADGIYVAYFYSHLVCTWDDDDEIFSAVLGVDWRRLVVGSNVLRTDSCDGTALKKYVLEEMVSSSQRHSSVKLRDSHSEILFGGEKLARTSNGLHKGKPADLWGNMSLTDGLIRPH